MSAHGGGHGFLARVVGRAHGDAAVVAPRLPGLFEPVFSRRPSIDAPGDGFATEAADAESRPASLPQRDAIAPDRFAASRDDGDGRLARPTRNRVAAPDHEPMSARERLVSKDVATPTTTPQPSAPTLRVSRTIVESTPRAALVARSTTATDALPSSAPLRRTDAPEQEASARRMIPSTTEAPSTQIQSAQSVLVPKFVAIETPRTAARGDRDPHATGAAIARAEPSVHISIGRIEVRAPAQTTTPAPRAPRAQRPMSLDEYLGRKERAR